MSNLMKTPRILHSKDCPALSKSQKIATRKAIVGENLTIRRALPQQDRKTIGAWCFLDHFGPLNLKNNDLKIGPHPHMGLQTFTYPLSGEILHRDSLGSKQKIQPNQVNLMTSGKGISHSEESLPDSILHGVQLWIALPDSHRFMAPDFMHYANIPLVYLNNLHIHVLAGEFLNTLSPVKVYSPLMAMEMHAFENSEEMLPLNPAFEYGILPLIGDIKIHNEILGLDTLLYIPAGASQLPVEMQKGSRALIIGGEPFKEDILIWWNFVARTEEEMIEAVTQWENHTNFGEVHGYLGDRLVPPRVP